MNTYQEYMADLAQRRAIAQQNVLTTSVINPTLGGIGMGVGAAGTSTYPFIPQYPSADTPAMLGLLAMALHDHEQLDTILDAVPWHESHISRADFERWFEGHKAQDKVNREARRRAELLQAKKNAALAKLSTEERRILGL